MPDAEHLFWPCTDCGKPVDMGPHVPFSLEPVPGFDFDVRLARGQGISVLHVECAARRDAWQREVDEYMEAALSA